MAKKPHSNVFSLAPRQVPAAMRKLRKQMEAGQRKAMIETAKFGVKAVHRVIRRTKPKPIAFKKYINSWEWTKTKHGAILGSSVKHAIAVEVDTSPHTPPFDAILAWVKIKRLGILKKKRRKVHRSKEQKEALKVHRESRRTLAQLSKKYDPVDKVAAERRRVRSKKRAKKRAAILDKMQRQIAWAVVMTIKHKGTKGRCVLWRTMPTLQKRAKRNSRKAVKDVIQGFMP